MLMKGDIWIENEINDEILRPLLETLSRICPSLIRLSIARMQFKKKNK